MTEIDYDGPGELHIVDIEQARTMDKSTFDTVMSVCQEDISDNVSDEQEYLFYNMSDGDTGYGGRSDYKLFADAATDLYYRLKNGQSVLIHCHMGRSRSVSVATAALGRLLTLRRSDAYEIVRRYRPQAQPKQLLYGYIKQYISVHTSIDNQLPFSYDK